MAVIEAISRGAKALEIALSDASPRPAPATGRKRCRRCNELLPDGFRSIYSEGPLCVPCYREYLTDGLILRLRQRGLNRWQIARFLDRPRREIKEIEEDLKRYRRWYRPEPDTRVDQFIAEDFDA